MAHNVITSGLEPRHMGWTDEAYRDHANVFGKGVDADAHHRRPQPVGLRADREEQRRRLPEARRLPARRPPGHGVHHRGREVVRRGVGDRRKGDIAVRTVQPATAYDPSTAPNSCRNLSIPGSRTRPVPRADRQERPGVPDPAGSGRPDVCAAATSSTRTRTTTTAPRTAFPSWLYPEEGNRFVPGERPGAPRRRHVGGGCGDRDDAERELVGHVRHDGRHRQGRVTCGAPRRTPHLRTAPRSPG